MSENNSEEMLQKKRGRGPKSNTKENKQISKIIPNKFKLGPKPKNKTSRINIIKPKPIKKSYSYNTQNINSYNMTEKNYLDEESELKREDSVQENSLGQLTKNFIKYIKTTGKKSININDLVNELDVKKRRIYDITNVLQGIGYIQKSGKNEIVWTQTTPNKSKQKKKSSINKKNINNKQKINKEELEKEKNELDTEINKFKAEFNAIAKKGEFGKYGYITLEDIRRMSIYKKVDLVVIKATKGTVMNVIDKNDINKAYDTAKNLMDNNEMKSNDSLLNILNKSNQLILTCPEDVGLTIYEINNGNIKEVKAKKDNNELNNNEQIVPNNKFMNSSLNVSGNNNKSPTFNQNQAILFNKQNININNTPTFNTNLFDKKYASNISNEKGNLETVQHNINVNNKQPNIGVLCASQNQKIGNYAKIVNPNIINNNIREDKLIITKNFTFSNENK